MKNIKNEKCKCSVEGCENKAEVKGLCIGDYHKYDNSADVAGVYKIILGDKLYVGMSYSGINGRVETEKSRLNTNNPQSVSRELLSYFNELCSKESQLSRKEVLEKYFDYDILQSSTRWLKVDENYNIVDFKNAKEQKDLTFKANISNNTEVQNWNKRSEKFWRYKEHKWISYYKNLDKENGTNYCLNIKD